jgi:gamma-glutamyltranspeptidase
MSPVLVFNRTLDGSLTPWMAIGAMGGATIIGSALHGLINTLAWQMDAQAAIDAPRAYPQNEVDQPLEPALYARFGAQLRALGYNATRGDLLDHYLYIAQICADGLYRGAADTTRLPESSAMAVSPASVKGDET